MPFTINDKGQVVDESGQPVMVAGEALVLEGVVTQATLERTMKERLARQETQHKRDREALIKEFEDKLANTVDPAEAEELRKKIHTLEEQTLSATELANKRVREKEQEYNAQLKGAQEKSQYHLQKFKDEKLNNAVISAAAKHNFIDPADALQQVREWAKWEDVIDPETNRATGEMNLVFHTHVVEEEGKDPVPKTMSAEEAVSHLAKSKPYMINGTGKQGWGGGHQTSHHQAPGRQEDWRQESTAVGKMAHGYGEK